MDAIIETTHGDLTHSSTVLMWILAASAGTYSVHGACPRLTRVGHWFSTLLIWRGDLFPSRVSSVDREDSTLDYGGEFRPSVLLARLLSRLGTSP